MADTAQAPLQETLNDTLARITKKPGVKATIALDRSSGAILKTAGQVSSIHTSRTVSSTNGGSFSADANDDTLRENQGVEEMSAMVWNFVKAAGTLVDEIDKEDELKLLRLRTKKQELFIIPDPKFLLIVVHDTPPV